MFIAPEPAPVALKLILNNGVETPWFKVLEPYAVVLATEFYTFDRSALAAVAKIVHTTGIYVVDWKNVASMSITTVNEDAAEELFSKVY